MPKTFLSSYFGFNKQQRNGIYVLISLSLLALLIRLSLNYFIQPDAIQLLNLPVEQIKSDSTWHSSPNGLSPNINHFEFNPNTIRIEELLKLGFSKKTADNLIKFREKGFVFREKRDLLKVYGVDENLFNRLETFIVIPSAEKVKQPNGFKNHSKSILSQEIKKLDLNTADSSSLITINGIGPNYAKRILKYRSLLGGFYSVEQLKEVYGMTAENYSTIRSQFYVDSRAIQKVNLNKDDFKKINKHPYISYEVCRSIFDWRRKTTITALNVQSILNNDSLYDKLLPYLSFE